MTTTAKKVTYQIPNDVFQTSLSFRRPTFSSLNKIDLSQRNGHPLLTGNENQNKKIERSSALNQCLTSRVPDQFEDRIKKGLGTKLLHKNKSSIAITTVDLDKVSDGFEEISKRGKGSKNRNKNKSCISFASIDLPTEEPQYNKPSRKGLI